MRHLVFENMSRRVKLALGAQRPVQQAARSRSAYLGWHQPGLASRADLESGLKSFNSSSRQDATIADAFDVVSEFNPPPASPSGKHEGKRNGELADSWPAQVQANGQRPKRVRRGKNAKKDGLVGDADMQSHTTAPLATEDSIPYALTQAEGAPKLLSEAGPPRSATSKVKQGDWRMDYLDQPRKTSKRRLGRFDGLAARRAPPLLVRKPLSQQAFEDFRAFHRAQIWRPDFRAQPPSALGAGPGVSQPHAESLLSRYDWRLRAPSQSPSQREAYGMKTIWRSKTDTCPLPEVSEDLGAYTARFQRFIDLERTYNEQAALLRLVKGHKLHQTQKTDRTPAFAEHIVGLRAKERSQKAKLPSLSRGSEQGMSASEAMEEKGRELVKADADEFDGERLEEELGKKKRSKEETMHLSFGFSGNTDLPLDSFRRGKIVFIWKCESDPSTGELYVPALQDNTIKFEELVKIPLQGYVEQSYLNRIDVSFRGRFPLDEHALYRLDVGYDDTSYRRMEEALRKLPLNAEDQRRTNLAISQGPHERSRDILIQGTEVRDAVLQGFAQTYTDHSINMQTMPAAPVSHNSIFLKDQWIASWAKRHSRKIPMQVDILVPSQIVADILAHSRMDGDPDLGLDESQLRAVANALANSTMLIQGVCADSQALAAFI